MGLLALCVVSCSIVRRSTASHHQVAQSTALAMDSTAHATAVWTSQAIAADTVVLTLPTTALHELPPTAVYQQKRGRASLTAQRKGDTLYLTATCDSLERLLHYYAARAAHWQQRATQATTTTTQTTKHTTSNTIFWPLAALALVAGAWLFFKPFLKR